MAQKLSQGTQQNHPNKSAGVENQSKCTKRRFSIANCWVILNFPCLFLASRWHAGHAIRARGEGGNSRWLKVSSHGFSYTLQNSRGHPKYALLLLPPEPGNVSSGSSPSSACRSWYCRSDVCSSSAHPEEEPPHSHYWGFAPGQQMLDPGISPPSPGGTSFHPCPRRIRGGRNASSPP